MRGRIGLHVFQQLPQHVAVARYRASGQAIRLAREWRQGMIGSEEITRAIDQVEMIPLFQGTL